MSRYTIICLCVRKSIGAYINVVCVYTRRGNKMTDSLINHDTAGLREFYFTSIAHRALPGMASVRRFSLPVYLSPLRQRERSAGPVIQINGWAADDGSRYVYPAVVTPTGCPLSGPKPQKKK